MEARHNFRTAPKKTAEWSRMEILAKPPEGAVQMALFLMAENLGPHDEVLFDDVVVRAIRSE